MPLYCTEHYHVQLHSVDQSEGRGCTYPYRTVEAGYNFVFYLKKYQYDADCELFLRQEEGG